MSRAQIADVVRSGQLTETELRKYVDDVSGEAGAAVRVLRLHSDRDPVRPARDPGERQHGPGFRPFAGIVFVYYVVMTVCSFAGEAFLAFAWLWAWMPNLLFTRDRPVAAAARRRLTYELRRDRSRDRKRAAVMAIAGGVAYVGDRVGHQVGRKRLTLFGIRPRYTSTIIAIATGMIIALVVTLGRDLRVASR